MPIETVLFFVAILAAVIALAVWAQRRAEQRRKELADWARAKGFSFSPEKDHGINSRFDGFDLFKQGSGHYAYNICAGSIARGERSAYAFDYHYQTTSVNSKGHTQTHHHQLSVLVVSTPLRLRELSIRSENIFDRISEFFGMDDIDFELAEFNRAFHVRAPDRRWAFDVLHQKAMEFMLASPRFILEFNAGRVMAYRNEVFSAKDFDDALAVVNGLLDTLPASVVRELSDSR